MKFFVLFLVIIIYAASVTAQFAIANPYGYGALMDEQGYTTRLSDIVRESNIVDPFAQLPVLFPNGEDWFSEGALRGGITPPDPDGPGQGEETNPLPIGNSVFLLTGLVFIYSFRFYLKQKQTIY